MAFKKPWDASVTPVKQCLACKHRNEPSIGYARDRNFGGAWFVECPRCYMRGPRHENYNIAMSMWNQLMGRGSTTITDAEMRPSTRLWNNGFIYVASPYSNPDPDVMKGRYLQVLDYVVSCVARREVVFSPIVHGHAVHMRSKKHATPSIENDHDFWLPYDVAFLRCCSLVRVLKIDGWRESLGVKTEWKMAKELGIPRELVDPERRDACEHR